MNECIDSHVNANVLSTLDVNSGYWQIDLDENDMNKTAFVTHTGLYRYLRMPFGLRNAHATFRRAIDIILAPVKWRHALIYIDDADVLSKFSEEQLNHVDILLQLINKVEMTLTLKKCFFF